MKQERGPAGSTASASVFNGYQDFFATQLARLQALDIDIAGCEISHLAFRAATVDEYIELRGAIEKHCTANAENLWKGRRISKLLLALPLSLGVGHSTRLIELIAPLPNDRKKTGLEHVGVVIGDSLDEFRSRNRHALTNQPAPGRVGEPLAIRFDDQTMVKFYRQSLHDQCVEEGLRFLGFERVETEQ